MKVKSLPCDTCPMRTECFLQNREAIEEGVQGVCINSELAKEFN